MSKENHLTEKDLANRWNFTVRTLQRWRRENRGPSYISMCGHIRYSKDAIKDFEVINLNLSSMTRLASCESEKESLPC
ncbi:MAG: hypothetical protein ACJAS6_001117 [Rickettsiales bacterium]|jgi:hypothetical protein